MWEGLIVFGGTLQYKKQYNLHNIKKHSGVESGTVGQTSRKKGESMSGSNNVNNLTNPTGAQEITGSGSGENNPEQHLNTGLVSSHYID